MKFQAIQITNMVTERKIEIIYKMLVCLVKCVSKKSHLTKSRQVSIMYELVCVDTPMFGKFERFPFIFIAGWTLVVCGS